jgi:hypothetical protein
MLDEPLLGRQHCHLVGLCRAVLLERMRWDARRMYQLHSIGGQAPPVQQCIAFDTNDDECPTAFFCCPCAFLQLAADWRVRIGAHCAQYCTWNTMHIDCQLEYPIITSRCWYATACVACAVHRHLFANMCRFRHLPMAEHPCRHWVALLTHGVLAGCSFNAPWRTLLLL